MIEALRDLVGQGRDVASSPRPRVQVGSRARRSNCSGLRQFSIGSWPAVSRRRRSTRCHRHERRPDRRPDRAALSGARRHRRGAPRRARSISGCSLRPALTRSSHCSRLPTSRPGIVDLATTRASGDLAPTSLIAATGLDVDRASSVLEGRRGHDPTSASTSPCSLSPASGFTLLRLRAFVGQHPEPDHRRRSADLEVVRRVVDGLGHDTTAFSGEGTVVLTTIQIAEIKGRRPPKRPDSHDCGKRYADPPQESCRGSWSWDSTTVGTLIDGSICR